MTRVRNLIVALTLIAAFSAVQALAQGQVIYNSIPSPLHGNVVSIGYEADSTSEFGDRIQFASGGRKLFTVTQTMSSWGCQAGHWYSNDCVSLPGSTFTHPLTLNIYNVGAGNSVGTLIGSVTQTFAIPYRPSASAGCSDGRWFNPADSTCYNGYATNVTFNLGGLVVPNQVIYSIAYNTSHSGYVPIGSGAACYASPGGCGYDSLNVGLEGNPTVGSAPAPADAYNNTTYAPYYCDGGTGGVGVFRLDSGCYAGDDFSWLLSTRFNAVNTPVVANDCKNGGWQSRTRADGSLFKNQGDCVSYTNNGR